MLISMKLYKPIMFFFLIFSIFLAMSSNIWFLMWMSMEINLLMFIPIMLSSNSNYETEAAIKYFLIQATASIIIMFLFMMNFYKTFIPNMNIIFFFTLMMKLGMAPCHLWFPQIMNCLTWMNCFILSSIQKIIPLYLISFMLLALNLYSVLLLVSINSLVGGWGGLNQTQMRPLLAYSSINHLAWMLASLSVSLLLTLMYFISYMIMNLPIFYNLFYNNSKSLFKYNVFSSMSYDSKLFLSMNFLSLGGMPPFLGFLPKWMLISSFSAKAPFLIIILIMGSLMSMFYYLSIVMNMMLSSFNINMNKFNLSLLYSTLSFFSFPFMFMIL
uniref:NADH-ubiquinone oxidoreductase chain 2 n=1 Tax=Myrianida brachycephala TaxID=884646 RepID=A0A1C9UZC1_MYRBC|nr:NADH dehydrogenase subunit 2 [Myrianida brachycephala]AOR87125.1 NADH dehydrogenase subunit 2 [Myrianida brachycephala]